MEITPSQLVFTNYSIPVDILVMKKNSMNNRFYPWPQIKYSCIINMVSCIALSLILVLHQELSTDDLLCLPSFCVYFGVGCEQDDGESPYFYPTNLKLTFFYFRLGHAILPNGLRYKNLAWSLLQPSRR